MNNFVFENATRFYFGTEGISHVAGELTAAGARKVMVAFGGSSAKRTGTFDQVAAQVAAAGAELVEFGGIMANPTLAKVMEGAELARAEGVDYVLAVGGGSVMDCCKMVALAAVDALPEDEFWAKYFQRFEPVTVSPLPLGIVVTATGTGSEGNGGGVITNEKTKVKTGADRPATNARFAVIDPTLTYTVPQGQKISGAYDSLNHMMEEYFSLPVGDVLADDLLEAAMGSVVRNLPKAIANPEDYQAHANLAWASALAENRVLKCGKQTCFQLHMIEHQVGAFTDCVHGLGLAAIACTYYRHIYDASDAALFQFGRFATNVWGIDPAGKTPAELAEAGIDALDAWTRDVGAYRTLSELGVTEEMLDPIADSIVCLPSSLKVLDRDEVRAILAESM